jgi:cytochrome b subunit of formate dehydrogenase
MIAGKLEMARKTLNFYMIKTTRISGWFLLPLTLLCIVSGFAMNWTWGFQRLLDSDMSLAIHQTFVWPLAGIFLVHAAASTYMAMRRWGWIGRRTKN